MNEIEHEKRKKENQEYKIKEIIKEKIVCTTITTRKEEYSYSKKIELSVFISVHHTHRNIITNCILSNITTVKNFLPPIYPPQLYYPVIAPDFKQTQPSN